MSRRARVDRPRTALLALGVLVLAAAWLGPLPGLASERFVAHMAMHVAVVALAAPLLAAGLAGSALDPVRRWPALLPAVPLSVLELVVIWGWHAPALHHLSRHETWALALEQGSFLFAALALWLAALGGVRAAWRARALAGIGGLLMASMHMTLLGVLLALAPRVLYGHGAGLAAALADQQQGGVLMLIGGGTSYLAGALYLLLRLLAPASPATAPLTGGARHHARPARPEKAGSGARAG